MMCLTLSGRNKNQPCKKLVIQIISNKVGQVVCLSNLLKATNVTTKIILYIIYIKNVHRNHRISNTGNLNNFIIPFEKKNEIKINTVNFFHTIPIIK